MQITNQHIADRINRENRRMANMEQKASPWFWVALSTIALLLLVRFDAERTINYLNSRIDQTQASAERYQRTAEVLAGCMNGQRFSVDGKALSCRIK